MARSRTIICFLFFCFGVLVPLGALGVRGVAGGIEFFAPELIQLVRFSIEQALLSLAFSLVLGIPLGLWVGFYPTRLAHFFLSIPYGVPTVIVGQSLIQWIGRKGLLAGLGLDWAYSLKAVILAHVLLNVPFIALQISQTVARIPKNIDEAARTLGAPARARFAFVLRPYLMPTLASASVQVFALCIMSFALVLLLGGGPPVETLETAIYAKIRMSNLDLVSAIACGFWQLALTVIPWMGVLFLQSKMQNLPQVPMRRILLQEHFDSPQLWLMHFICSLGILPYAVLFRFGVSEKLFSSSFWGEIGLPLKITFKLAFSTAVLSVFIGFLAVASRKKWIQVLLSLPSGISVLALSLGVWLAYSNWIDPFEGSLSAMIFIQTVLFVPLTIRILFPLLQGKQNLEMEAARTLGATRSSALYWIEWPRWRGPIFSALSLVVGASLGEVAAVSLFFSEKITPASFLISRWMIQYRFDEAQALSLLLLGLILITMGLTQSFSREAA